MTPPLAGGYECDRRLMRKHEHSLETHEVCHRHVQSHAISTAVTRLVPPHQTHTSAIPTQTLQSPPPLFVHEPPVPLKESVNAMRQSIILHDFVLVVS